MKEPANANTTSQFAKTVYGMPAHVDRDAAVGEVHARPHLLIQAPRGLLQFAFMTEGDPKKDRAAMTELPDRLGVASPDLATPLDGLTWNEEERLATLSEEAVSGYCTWQDFLLRRIAPAMWTCQSVKERQAKLSDKLTRATSLLRSWIDVELERQNRDLLTSMNNRAKLQLRLQQTVEGLSVAAISYYVVSLLGYLLEGIPIVHDVVAPVMAVLVPVVMLAIWWIVRRIRHATATRQWKKDIPDRLPSAVAPFTETRESNLGMRRTSRLL